MLNLFSIAIVTAVIIPLILWFYAVGHPLDYLDADVPSGQLLYVLSKLAGLLGIALLVLQLTFVHIGRRARLARLGWSTGNHRALGVAVLCLVCLHVGLFIAAAGLRSGHLALGPLSLRFTQGFYDQMVSLGAIAFYILLLFVFLGYLFFRFFKREWLRRLHGGLALMAAALAAVHSYAIGSETRSLPMIFFYAMLIAALIWGLFNALNADANHE